MASAAQRAGVGVAAPQQHFLSDGHVEVNGQGGHVDHAAGNEARLELLDGDTGDDETRGMIALAARASHESSFRLWHLTSGCPRRHVPAARVLAPPRWGK